MGFLLPVHYLKCSHSKWYQLHIHANIWIFSSCLKMVVATFYWVSVICRHCTRFFTALSFILFPSTKIDMVSTIFHSFIQHVFVSDIYIYLYLYTNIYICIYIWFLKCAQALSQVLRMFQWAKQPPKITSSWSLHFHKRNRWRSGSMWGSDKPKITCTVVKAGIHAGRSSWLKTCVLCAISPVYLLEKSI